MPHWGIFEHWRRMAEELKPPEQCYVRLQAPPGIGSVQTFSGRHLNVGPDGTVEMSADDAQYFIRAGWTNSQNGRATKRLDAHATSPGSLPPVSAGFPAPAIKEAGCGCACKARRTYFAEDPDRSAIAWRDAEADSGRYRQRLPSYGGPRVRIPLPPAARLLRT